MLVERIENRWLAAFTRTFTLCKVQPGEVVAILAETQSRRVNVDLARLALEASPTAHREAETAKAHRG